MYFDKMHVNVSDHPNLENLRSLVELYSDSGKYTPDFEQWMNKTEKAFADFEKTLSPQQRKLYDICDDYHGEKEDLLTGEGFVMGFKLATRLLLEGLK